MSEHGHRNTWGAPAGGWDAWKGRAAAKRENGTPPEPLPIIYIAGPMRGKPNRNHAAFHAAAALLRSHGYSVISPAEMDDVYGDMPDGEAGVWEPEDRHAIRRDIKAVLESDAVYVLPGWERSVGAKLEVRIALAAGIPLMWETEPVGDWTPLEPLEIEDEFVNLLSFGTGDGANKRRSGEKVSWKVDDGHEAAMYRHLERWVNGETVDRDSGAHPLVHTAWRCLAQAWRETQDS